MRHGAGPRSRAGKRGSPAELLAFSKRRAGNSSPKELEPPLAWEKLLEAAADQRQDLQCTAATTDAAGQLHHPVAKAPSVLHNLPLLHVISSTPNRGLPTDLRHHGQYTCVRPAKVTRAGSFAFTAKVDVRLASPFETQDSASDSQPLATTQGKHNRASRRPISSSCSLGRAPGLTPLHAPLPSSTVLGHGSGLQPDSSSSFPTANQPEAGSESERGGTGSRDGVGHSSAGKPVSPILNKSSSAFAAWSHAEWEPEVMDGSPQPAQASVSLASTQYGATPMNSLTPKGSQLSQGPMSPRESVLTQHLEEARLVNDILMQEVTMQTQAQAAWNNRQIQAGHASREGSPAQISFEAAKNQDATAIAALRQALSERDEEIAVLQSRLQEAVGAEKARWAATFEALVTSVKEPFHRLQQTVMKQDAELRKLRPSQSAPTQDMQVSFYPTKTAPGSQNEAQASTPCSIEPQLYSFSMEQGRVAGLQAGKDTHMTDPSTPTTGDGMGYMKALECTGVESKADVTTPTSVGNAGMIAGGIH